MGEELIAKGGAIRAGHEACELLLDSVFEELRHRRLDAIVHPYSVLHSIDNIVKDTMCSAAFADRRIDDHRYAEDEAAHDPLQPQKDAWAIHHFQEGGEGQLAAILKRQKHKDCEITADIATHTSNEQDFDLDKLPHEHIVDKKATKKALPRVSRAIKQEVVRVELALVDRDIDSKSLEIDDKEEQAEEPVAKPKSAR